MQHQKDGETFFWYTLFGLISYPFRRGVKPDETVLKFPEFCLILKLCYAGLLSSLLSSHLYRCFFFRGISFLYASSHLITNIPAYIHTVIFKFNLIWIYCNPGHYCTRMMRHSHAPTLNILNVKKYSIRLKYSIAFTLCICPSNHYLMDRCYKLFDSLSKFTVQSILRCYKRHSDWSTGPC